MSNSIRASIDIGSNSVLLLVASLNNDVPKFIESKTRITSLGRDLDKTKVFHVESMNLTYEALKEFKDICVGHNILPENILITATEASRVATNAKVFYMEIKQNLNLDVKIINSQAEAYYSMKGVLFLDNFVKRNIHLIDLGGASSELIKIDTINKNIISSFSMPVGGVRASDWLRLGEFESRMDDIYKSYKDQLVDNQTGSIFFVGGTITSIASMLLNLEEFKESLVNHYKISIFDLEMLQRNLQDETEASLHKRYPFLGKRSKSIYGGVRSILQICKWLNVEDIEVLTYGLRYGTLLEGEIKNEFIIK